MAENGLALTAHLLRRAGFGAGRDELEAYAARGYEVAVEDLLHPERYPDVDDDVVHRYHLELNNSDTVITWPAVWVYRMINTRRPLQEKLALFWHHIFATSVGKSEHGPFVREADQHGRRGPGGLQLERRRDPDRGHLERQRDVYMAGVDGDGRERGPVGLG